MTTLSSHLLLPFESDQATLETAGGKGANLSRLWRCGFPVPPGFIIPTSAYLAFVAANGLEPVIGQALENLAAGDAASLEWASSRIREAFTAGKIPDALEAAINRAYARLGSLPVAVRSSATAEDLPDLSFAGQQDTYLNITGETQLRAAIINCWSSLWTGRAIGYRLRNQISHAGAALAVIVQAMVPSEVSGVLFTVNPLTGKLSEAVIDATFGLGEALVSGQVDPDHFVVDARRGEVLAKKLGAKQVSTRAVAGGGVESIAEAAGERQTLSTERVRQLAALGQQIQNEYGTPQDIEWALADSQLYILQARPITSLFPVPEVSADPLIIWFSFGAVQGIMGPMTPLGLDLVRRVFIGAGKLFGAKIDYDQEDVLVPAGERMWIKVSDLIRHPLGKKVAGAAMEFIEPSVGRLLVPLIADPQVGAGQGRFKFSTRRQLVRFFLPAAARALLTALDPEKARARFDAVIENRLRASQIAPAADRYEKLSNVVAAMLAEDRVTDALHFLLPLFFPIMAPSMAALTFLTHISGDGALALEVTRGLPRNVTTEMDLALWQTAAAIRADAGAASFVRQSEPSRLAAGYLEGTLPAAAQKAIAGFMEKYGMRGVGEIDFGRTRWREDPVPVMHTLQSYLQIDPGQAPDVLFKRGELAAQAAIEKIAAAARRQPGGWLKEKLVRGAARRIRLLMGARESPKFYIIRAMGIVRKALLEAGREFAAAGTIERADDLVFLKVAELEELTRRGQRDWKALIAGRRRVYERELRRRQVPRVLVSDGRAFYDGLGAETDGEDVITGSPVSPGVAEGVVHVVLDPHGTQLAPGEILVCPGTDPAWTPLFMAAGGLITEVGGMMTHGSVVAREYGIPAVVGVHQATLRLKNGQRIRLDGTQGKIVVL